MNKLKNHRSLICITSCNRLTEVKKFIWSYIQFVKNTDTFDFLLSVDGNEKAYFEFALQYKIPAVFSEQREGVGISKNRVLEFFPDYDYYFFIEDDIELFNPKVFDIHIILHKETGIHHFGYGVKDIDQIINTKYGNITCGWFGSAQFNFFTRKGLNKVGGWHPLFASYKRFGHTEHTYRFYFQKLNLLPFCAFEDIDKYIVLHDPPHVTKLNLQTNANQLIKDEQDLIDNKNHYHPVETLSDYRFNGKSLNCSTVDKVILAKPRYSLLSKNLKRKAWSDFHFYLFASQTKGLKKLYNFLLALILFPTNPKIKHFLKLKLLKNA